MKAETQVNKWMEELTDANLCELRYHAEFGLKLVKALKKIENDTPYDNWYDDDTGEPFDIEDVLACKLEHIIECVFDVPSGISREEQSERLPNQEHGEHLDTVHQLQDLIDAIRS